MESEVSGIAKLGIVLIALAVLIGLGFGIFQISKGTANTGVTNVQGELDGVASSAFTTYDQTIITGQMVRSAVSDFEGEEVAVLIATQAWVNLLEDASYSATTGVDTSGTAPALYTKAAGISTSFPSTGKTTLPVVACYTSNELTTAAQTMTSSKGTTVNAAYINYNAILGNKEEVAGTTKNKAKVSGVSINMGGMYFDANCYRCESGFASDTTGKVLFNNISGNISKTGQTEFVPTGAKYQAYLIKDASGTNMGIALSQISGN